MVKKGKQCFLHQKALLSSAKNSAFPGVADTALSSLPASKPQKAENKS